MTQDVFCEYFPYHLVFNSELMVLQAGVHIQRIMPKLRSLESHPVDSFFEMIHPQIDWTIKSIQKFENMQFILQTKRAMITDGWGSDKPMLQLRGKGFTQNNGLCGGILSINLLFTEAQMRPSELYIHL